jgi:hypothetical protein
MILLFLERKSFERERRVKREIGVKEAEKKK